jgi:hypothetical protein
VLALITKLDGVNALLFHVEHWSNGKWQYRMMGSDREWMSPVTVSGESVVVPLVHATNEVTVEWRVDESCDWIAAAPHEFGNAECEFSVHVVGSYSASRPDDYDIVACGLVRGNPSAWKLSLPRRPLQNEVLRVMGVSRCFGIGQVLRYESEFQSRGGVFQMMNLTPSQAALLPVQSAIPSALPFTGTFFVRSGRLSDEEIQILKADVPPTI